MSLLIEHFNNFFTIDTEINNNKNAILHTCPLEFKKGKTKKKFKLFERQN